MLLDGLTMDKDAVVIQEGWDALTEAKDLAVAELCELQEDFDRLTKENDAAMETIDRLTDEKNAAVANLEKAQLPQDVEL